MALRLQFVKRVAASPLQHRGIGPLFRRPLLSAFDRVLSTAAAAEGSSGLIITDRCAKRIVQLNIRKGLEDPALQQILRLSVEPGGCSGFSYKFELEDASELDDEDDSLFEKDGARVVVDQSSLQLLAGSTVDYEDEMMKSAFVVTDNPQSAQGCGCGTSFSVEI